MRILLSVVIATFNRASKIRLLLEDLSRQTTSWFDVECIVTNDGSRDNTSEVLKTFSDEMKLRKNNSFRFLMLEQKNSGQAKARQNAIDNSQGEVIVILDDDMRIPSNSFLETYLSHFFPKDFSMKESNAEYPSPFNKVVIGRMDPPEDEITRKPFEYFYERSLEQMYANFLTGKSVPQGGDLFTGNVALTKKAFLKSGGFSEKFKYGEDKELGLRLSSVSKSVFVFENKARTIHHSDTPSMQVFTSRARKHGFFDCEIQRLYPDNPELGPANLLNLPGFCRQKIVNLLLNFSFLRELFIFVFTKIAQLVVSLKLTKLASYACSFVYLAAYINGAIEGMAGKENLRANLASANMKK